jgi:hypothetical protein
MRRSDKRFYHACVNVYDVLADGVVGFLCVETSEIFSVQHN